MSPNSPKLLPAQPPVRAVGVRNPHTNAVTVDRRIQTILEAIRCECGAPLTAYSMAARISISRSRFEHLFHLQTGQTFREVLQEARLAKAANLLAQSNFSIEEISFKCGYSSSQSLDRAFRKRFGRSPSAYRSSTYGYRIAQRDTTLKLTA